MAIEIPEVPDGVLVGRHLRGETEAFEELFDRYYPRLIRFCIRRVGDQSASEDIAQETLLQALKYLEGFDPERPMWPWLRTIAGHEVSRFLSSRHEELSINDAWNAPTVPDEADLLGVKDLLGRALKRLAPSQRIAFGLRYLDEWSLQEVAEFLGMRKHAVEQMLSRARVKLREEYERLSEQGRERLGLLLPPLLPFRSRLRQWTARFRNQNELMRGGSAAGPLINPLVGLAAAGVALGVILVGAIHDPNVPGESADQQGQGQMGSQDAATPDARQPERVSKGSSRSMHASTEQIVGGTPGSASGSVEVTKTSLRARIEAKTPGDHEVIIPAWVGTDAECDYSVVQQAICDGVDRLPDQD